MTQIELLNKIRQEVERLSYEEQGFNSEEAEYGYRSCARDLLSFLDTLQEPSCDTCTNDKGCVTCMYGELWEGKEQEPELDLEKEMDEYFENMAVQEHENIFVDTYHNIARHFAKWGAEHSGSSEIPNELEAVECDVIVPIYEGNDVWSAEIKIPGRYEPGDRVRVIVIPKTDEK